MEDHILRNASLNSSVADIESDSVELHQINDDNAQDAFGWHLERAIIQIKSFGEIIHNVITSFYGDMQSA